MFIQKNKAVSFINVSFQKRFSLSDHLNVITTNINIYFAYIVAKTMCKIGHHKTILQLHASLLISEKYHVLGKVVRLLLKAVF